jgi:hypothetical protein
VIAMMPSNPRRLIWDTGPQRPRELDAPLDQPAADAVADLAIYEKEIQRRAEVFRAYGAEYAEWLRVNGGPVQMDMHATSAAEALQRDPRRYCVDLPPDVLPGWKTGGDRVVI